MYLGVQLGRLYLFFAVWRGVDDSGLSYTVLQKYEHTGLKQNLLRSITLDIITRLFDNGAFVCIHVVARFSKDFSEVRGVKSRGFQLQVE